MRDGTAVRRDHPSPSARAPSPPPPAGSGSVCLVPSPVPARRSPRTSVRRHAGGVRVFLTGAVAGPCYTAGTSGDRTGSHRSQVRGAVLIVEYMSPFMELMAVPGATTCGNKGPLGWKVVCHFIGQRGRASLCLTWQFLCVSHRRPANIHTVYSPTFTTTVTLLRPVQVMIWVFGRLDCLLRLSAPSQFTVYPCPLPCLPFPHGSPAWWKATPKATLRLSAGSRPAGVRRRSSSSCCNSAGSSRRRRAVAERRWPAVRSERPG